MRHATCAFTPWDRRAAGAGADQAPAPDRVPPADPRCRPGQPWSALVPLDSRPLVRRRWQRAVGTRVADARESRRGGADPAAERPQPPLRARRTRFALVAAVAALERLQRAPGRRDPCRRRAGRDRVAVRVCRGGGCGSGGRRDARAHRLPRRPDGARRRLRGSAGAQPRAQRVRAFAPLRRLDRDRALLGADASPRAGRPGVARLGTRGRDREHRLAVAAAAACTHHD